MLKHLFQFKLKLTEFILFHKCSPKRKDGSDQLNTVMGIQCLSAAASTAPVEKTGL